MIVWGSINLDLVVPVPRLPAAGETVLGRAGRIEPGGKGANQALAASRAGARVMLAGAVGDDALALPALALLRQAGIDLSRVATLPAHTGFATIAVDAGGANQIAVAAGANALARHAQLADADLARGTLLLQGECDLAETAALIHRARALDARVLLNLAPAARLPPDALAALDILIVNESEAAALGQADAAGLHAAFGCTAIRTLGAAGLEIADAAGPRRIAGLPVAAVDTTAAGDCFCGVLAAGLEAGLALDAAAARANRAAALCCTRHGSQASLPETGF